MAAVPIRQILDMFPFLDDRTAQEPFLYDVLREIKSCQADFVYGKRSSFASKETIHTSRNIKMPFTPARDKNIDYLLELVVQRYGEHVVKFTSFEFSFNDKTKKISLKENEYYALEIAPEDIERMQNDFDEQSLNSLATLLSTFRIFNLSKLMKGTLNKNDMTRIIKKALGKQIFTFKNYKIDKNRVGIPEDYCFHANNYDPVKKSLNLDRLKTIISAYTEMVKLRLKRFGIINVDFEDYRDNKLDYILHVLNEDIASSLKTSDLVEVKNIQSLRECIIKVDKILDPARIYGEDILKFIRENKHVSETDITSNLLYVTTEILKNWSTENNLVKEHIVKYTEPDGQNIFFDGKSFIPIIEDTYQMLRYSPEKIATMSSAQKQLLHNKMNTLYQAGCRVIANPHKRQILATGQEQIDKVEQIINEYEQYSKELSLRTEEQKTDSLYRKEKKSFIKKIIDFFSSMFSAFGQREEESNMSSTASENPAPRHVKKTLSRETRQIYSKATNRKGPVTPLSSIIELNRENDIVIDRLIDELRKNNVKIVIPIYNARTVLYPKRSKKLLIPDIEYLLVPPHAIKTPESITEFIDSLVGFKIKDDILTGSALIAIEKYLRTLYRQKRAQLLQKEKQKLKKNK